MRHSSLPTSNPHTALSDISIHHRFTLLPDAFPANRPGGHNRAVTDGQFTGGQFTPGQATEPCPQCGSAAGVHSIGELAALAQMQLDKAQGLTQQQGAQQQQGWNAEPRSGAVPGWAAEPQAGPPRGAGGWSGRTRDYDYRDSPLDSVDQAIADVALGAAARFLGRAVSKRVQRTVNDRVMPAMATMAAKQQETLRAQIAIAQQHPDIRACMTDHVIFLAGGSRVLPMPNLGTLTTQQADMLVAQLSQG
jgi:hypothetical protein